MLVRTVVAARIARRLNDFIGHLHAARSCQAIWLRVHEDPRYSITAKYGLQIVFGVIALTMRKFEDFYDRDLHQVIPDKSKRPAEAKSLVQESKKRHLRTAANTLIAHYKDDTRQLPSSAEIAKLIEHAGWATEEDVMNWVESAINRLIVVRDAIMKEHNVKDLDA